MGRKEIDGYVTEVRTEVDPSEGLRLADLPLKSHQRVFHERVPLPSQARRRIQLSDPWDYANLAEGVEAWGFRAIQRRGEFMTRQEAAEAWFPDGPTDPDLALVQVEIIHANYWDVKQSKPVQLFAMAKSVFTGKPPQLGEHAEVRMR
jgi:hypothetical protein